MKNAFETFSDLKKIHISINKKGVIQDTVFNFLSFYYSWCNINIVYIFLKVNSFQAYKFLFQDIVTAKDIS